MKVKDEERRGEREVTLFLPDYHLERTAPLYQELVAKEGNRRGLVYYRGEVIWDEYEMMELAKLTGRPEKEGGDGMAEWASDAVNTARHSLFGDLPDEFETVPHIGMVWGTKKGLDEVFGQLLDSFDDPLGGDDDAFDYWPNGMITLMMLAHDLDGVGWHDPEWYISRVRGVCDARRHAFNQEQIAQGRTPEERIDFDTEVFAWPEG